MNYSLNALFKLREHKNAVAETSLREAIERYELEKKKLADIEISIRDAVHLRTEVENKFFLRAQAFSCNKRELNCHLSSKKKHLGDENALKQILIEQKETVKHSSVKVELAKLNAIDAHRNLRVIEKHYSAWQQQKRKAEGIKEDYECDDQNGVRFLLKKV